MPGGDRRPIGLRYNPVVLAIAKGLAGAGIAPNVISIASILFALLGAIAFAATSPESVPLWRLYWVLGAAGAGLRGLCNIFDGLVAVEHGKASPVGLLFNEIPDRFADSFLLIGMGIACGDPELGLFAALCAVLTAYIRAQGRAAGAPSDFGGPMNKQQRMYLIIGVALFNAVAPRAWSAPSTPWNSTDIALTIISVGCAITWVTRLQRISRALWAQSGQTRP